uniref:Hexosyltransferase n=2 Tax=Poecilia mexicana TaxID=48701 RepID=A0A3B3Y801_9TELE
MLSCCPPSGSIPVPLWSCPAGRNFSWSGKLIWTHHQCLVDGQSPIRFGWWRGVLGGDCFLSCRLNPATECARPLTQLVSFSFSTKILSNSHLEHRTGVFPHDSGPLSSTGTKAASFVPFPAAVVLFHNNLSNPPNPLSIICHSSPVVALHQEPLKETTQKPLKKTLNTTSFFMRRKQCSGVRSYVLTANCLLSLQMQQLFYENYEPNKKGYIRDLHNSKIHRAITLHPNKNPPYQYRLHSYLLSRKIADLRHRTIQLHREIVQMGRYGAAEPTREDLQLGIPPSFMRFHPHQREEVLEWEFLTGKYLFSSSDSQPPRRGMDSSQRQALDDIIMQVMEMINANAKTRGRVIDFKEIQYGYRRVNPLYGAEYVLDLLLLYKKHKGKTMTVPVRRHAYLQQTFSQIQFREEDEMDARALASHINQESDSLSFLSNSLKMLVPFKLTSSGQDQREPKESKVNILVPLSGRYDIFVRFMANFEKVCLIPNLNVKLLILLFSTDNNTERVKQVELMREYHLKYPRADMEIKPVAGSFSRALALEVGSLHFSNNSLLFYCDVDLLFSSDFLKRCRTNTALGEQAYFPIIFSQYDPKVVYSGKVPSNNHYVFTSKTGLWRTYGFGIVCVYKGDLVRAGGFDTSIQGWGLEDVDLYNKFVQSGIKLFRSTDTGIVHVHHPVICDPNLEAKQYKMCLGSKASSYGSTQQLSELWLEKNDHGFGKLASSNASVRTA